MWVLIIKGVLFFVILKRGFVVLLFISVVFIDVIEGIRLSVLSWVSGKGLCEMDLFSIMFCLGFNQVLFVFVIGLIISCRWLLNMLCW